MFYPKFFQTLFLFSILLLLGNCSKNEDPVLDTEPEPINNNIKVETIPIDNTGYKGDDGLSIDSKGNIYVSHLASGVGSTIYKVEPDGTITFFATGLSGPMGHFFDKADNLYVAFNQSSQIARIDVEGNNIEYIKDNRFLGGSLVVDDDGTIYHSVFKSNSVYKISPNKDIELLASGSPLNVPFGITLDGDKNVYVANFSNGIINKITPQGELSTLADIPSKVGYLIYSNGKLYATGFTTHKIYEIELDGTFTTLVGGNSAGNNDGQGAEVSFDSPNGIAASADGKTLFISQKNFKIRKVTLE